MFVSDIECSIYNWAHAVIKTGKGKLAPVHAIKAYGHMGKWRYGFIFLAPDWIEVSG